MPGEKDYGPTRGGPTFICSVDQSVVRVLKCEQVGDHQNTVSSNLVAVNTMHKTTVSPRPLPAQIR